MRAHIVVFLAILLSLGACRTKDDEPNGPEPNFVPVSRQALTVNLIDLALNPEAFEASYIQIGGEYSRLPRLFCDDDPHPSPASWSISAESFTVSASGYDSQLNALLPDGVTITVAGHWQKWQGPVGCGKRATNQTIWYLEVDEVLSPSPLVLVTLTPSDTDGLPIAAKPTPAETPTVDGLATMPPESTPADTPAPGEPTHTPIPTLTALPGFPSPTSTTQGVALTPQATSTATPDSNVIGTATIGATAGPTATTDANQTPLPPTSISTPAPTATTGNVPPPTNTPTTVATQPPLSTATPSINYRLVDQGSIEAEELVTGFLDTSELHSWNFVIDPGEFITVSVAAAPAVDIVLSITDDAGNQLWEQNQSPADEIEQIDSLQLNQAGGYQVRLQAANGNSGSYALMMLEKSSYHFVSLGILDYGDQINRLLEEETDHFWYFYGSTDDAVRITATPNDNGDLFMEVYGADGLDMGGFIDNGAGGEQEVVELVLPETGIYSIRLGEYEFLPSSYTIKMEG